MNNFDDEVDDDLLENDEVLENGEVGQGDSGKSGIKSRNRVCENGEVFTPQNIVLDMLKLIPDDGHKVDTKYLEPACGNGNFLVEIIRDKLETVVTDERFKSNPDFGYFVAFANTYGVDIMIDNINESINRMLDVAKECYLESFGTEMSYELFGVLKYVAEHNIIHGDTLESKEFVRKKKKTRPGKRKANNNIEATEDNVIDLIVIDWKIDYDNMEVTRSYSKFSDIEQDILDDETLPFMDVEKFNEIDALKGGNGHE